MNTRATTSQTRMYVKSNMSKYAHEHFFLNYIFNLLSPTPKLVKNETKPAIIHIRIVNPAGDCTFKFKRPDVQDYKSINIKSKIFVYL